LSTYVECNPMLSVSLLQLPNSFIHQSFTLIFSLTLFHNAKYVTQGFPFLPVYAPSHFRIYIHHTLADVKSSSHPSRVGHTPSSFPLGSKLATLHSCFILSSLAYSLPFPYYHDRRHDALLGTHYTSSSHSHCHVPMSPDVTHSYTHVLVSSTTIDNRSPLFG